MKGVSAVKRLLSVILTIVLCAGTFAAGYKAYANDGYEPDVYDNSTIALHVTDSAGNYVQGKTGSYTVGDDFYFKIVLEATTSIKGDKVSLRINFADSEDVSGFMYKNTGGTWVDASTYYGASDNPTTNLNLTYAGNYSFYFKTKFNKVGQYVVNYTAYCPAKEYTIRGVEYINIKSDGTYYHSSIEDEETEPAVETTDDSTENDIYIDGAHWKTVSDGSSCRIPSEAGKGYYDTTHKKLYHPGAVLINITGRINLTSVDSIVVKNGTGASITVDGSNIIRFRTYVTIKNLAGDDIAKKLVMHGAVQLGTILTTYDYYTEHFECDFKKSYLIPNSGEEEVDLSGYYADVHNPVDDWPIDDLNNNIYGTCYAGIFHVNDSNISRQFVAVGYAECYYEGEDEPEIIDSTNRTYPIRSIKQLAIKIRDDGYKGLNEDQIAQIDYYCSK